MKKPTAIVFSDPHLRDTQPVCRTDDFWQTQKGKFMWLQVLHKKVGLSVPMICAGDVFHEWKTSPKLIDMALDYLPKNLISVPGQHDMPSHKYDLLNEAGYGIINKVDKISNPMGVHNGSYVLGKKMGEQIVMRVWFFPYGSELHSINPDPPHLDIAVVHHFVYKGRKPFPGQLTGVKSLLQKLKGYQLVITGDNHQPFTYRTDDQLLINPGCFSRQKADEAKIEPRVYLWYAEDNSFDIQYVPTEPADKVISRKHLEQIEYKNEKIEIFVGRLNENINIQLDFKSNMRAYLKGNPKIRKLTKQKIQEAMA